MSFWNVDLSRVAEKSIFLPVLIRYMVPVWGDAYYLLPLVDDAFNPCSPF